MAAFAQREHFLERPMFLTAPPVGRLAVQNSQRFHYYGELRVNLDSVKVDGAERLDFRLRTLRFVFCMVLRLGVCVLSGGASWRSAGFEKRSRRASLPARLVPLFSSL
jgi:hypothetical protein